MRAMVVKTMLVTFKNKLSFREVPLFRGALLNKAQGDNTLFHDHIGDKFRYSYPLVQYRTVDGYAAVFCLNEGINAVENIFGDTNQMEVRIGRRNEMLVVDHKVCQYDDIAVIASPKTYCIYNYLPLNQENYSLYMETDSIVERYSIIEKCLTGNILSFAKSLGVFFERQINLSLLDVIDKHELKYKNINMLGFSLKFKTDVLLPRYIALGKGVSLGFGIIK